MDEKEKVSIEAVKQILEEALDEAYYCTRVWSAWSYGTMTGDDFELVDIEGIIEQIRSKDKEAENEHKADR